jgi:hypothetical protein
LSSRLVTLVGTWKTEEAAKAAAARELVSDEDPLGFSLVVVEQLPSFDLLKRIRLTTSTLSPSSLGPML